MQDPFYVEAAMRFIATLLLWISGHDPGRTAPLTWDEVLSNVDTAADAGDRDAIQMIITDQGYFGFAPRWAWAVVDCETGGTWDPRAYNPAGPYVSIWQVYNGPTGVRPNTEAALSIYRRQGWRAWSLCGANHWRYELAE